MSYKVIIDIIANGQRAVAEFDKAGRAAERMAKKTSDEVEKARISTEKFGRQAGVAGTAMLGAAGSVAFAMRGWVKSAQEAEQAQMRLESSVRGSYGASSNAIKAFEAQAKAIQKVTVAADEDVMGIQAMLVQFGLTQRQVLTLTPLVVDISRKWGIDYVSAAKAVSKAADGKATALKKLGINVDETKAKTDPYIATVEALRRAAGGFAQQEGKTFAGQTAILSNQLDELKESLGRGVLDVLNKTLPAVNAAASGFTSLDAATGGVVGSTTAIATGFLAAAGAAALTVKAVIGLKTAYQEAAAAEGLMGAATRGAGAVAFVGSAVAIGTVIGAALGGAINEQLFHFSDKAADGYKNALSADNGKEIFRGFLSAAEGEAGKTTNILLGVLKTAGNVVKAFATGGDTPSLMDAIVGPGFDKAFQKIAEASPAAAKELLAYADAHPKLKKAVEDAGGSLDEYRRRLGDVYDINKNGKVSVDEFNKSIENQGKAAQELISVVSTQESVARGFAQAQIGVAQAQQQVTDAQKSYNDAVKSGDPEKIKEASLGLQSAMLGLAAAQDQARDAAFKHAEMLLALQSQADDPKAFKIALDQLGRMRDILTDPAEKKAIEDRMDALVKLQIVAGEKIDLNDQLVIEALYRMKAVGAITEAQLRALQTWRMTMDTSQAVSALEGVGSAARLTRNQLMAIQVLTSGYGKGVLTLDAQLRLARRVAETGSTPQELIAGGFRAAGGPVSAGSPYIVGERGPELFVPSTSGMILPNSQIAARGAISPANSVITINVTSSALSTPAETGAAVVDALKAYQRQRGSLPLRVA